MILILNGSPRKNGVSTRVLRAIEAGMSNDSVEWVDVNDLAIKPCIGCLKCRPDKVCVLPQDDAHRVGELLRACTALVVGSPTYWGNVTGPLKLLFDRNVPTLEYIDGGIPKPNHRGKKAVVVVASAAPFPFNLLPSQSGGAVRALRTVLRGSGFRIARTINVPNTRRSERVEERVLARARAVGQRL